MFYKHFEKPEIDVIKKQPPGLKRLGGRKLQISKHGSYYSAEFIFPDLPGENESYFLTNLFMRNTNVGFQSLATAVKTRAAEQI